MDGSGIKKLLCTWHVDKGWKNKLNLIRNKEKQENVYKMLCTLRKETRIDSFNNYMNTFIEMLFADAELKEFGQYFPRQYKNRRTVWAVCHRLGSGINTNMFLESMHRTLKKGTHCKRLDKTINALMKFVRNKQFERVIKLTEGKITYKISLSN